MKKVLSIILSLVMLASCVSINSFSAFANTVEKAKKAELNDTISITINSNASKESDQEYFIKFTPSKTGYYEFNCNKANTKGMVITAIAEEMDSEDVIVMNYCDPSDPYYNNAPTIAAKLNANHTYYWGITGEDCGKFSADITVKKHKHTNDSTDVPAFNNQEIDYYADGGRFQYCQYCIYNKKVETYYYPKTIKLSKSSYVYDGKKKAPKVTVKDRKGNVIAKSNYKVTYKNNKNPGKATVIVTFNDKKYAGTLTKTFTIKPKKQTLSSVKSGKSKQITIKWKKDTTVTGYQVQYSTSSKFKSAKSVNVSKNSTTSKNISKLKGGKKYYVRVRAYKTVDGKKIYSAWSSAKTVTVKK